MFTVVSDTLKNINLLLNYDLSLSELVNHLGPPDYIGAPIGIEGDTSHCEVFLFWIGRQIMGRFYSPSTISYELPEEFEMLPLVGRDRPWPGFSKP